MIETDTGQTGYGEAPATAVNTGDTLSSIAGTIEFMAPHLIGRSITAFNELIHTVQTKMVHNHSGKAAIEIALYDLFAQWHDKPLYQVLGAETPI